MKKQNSHVVLLVYLFVLLRNFGPCTLIGRIQFENMNTKRQCNFYFLQGNKRCRYTVPKINIVRLPFTLRRCNLRPTETLYSIQYIYVYFIFIPYLAYLATKAKPYGFHNVSLSVVVLHNLVL